MAKQPYDLKSVIDLNINKEENDTSARTDLVMVDNLPKALSIKMDAERYAHLRNAAYHTGKTHRAIMLEAFDLWVETNGKNFK